MEKEKKEIGKLIELLNEYAKVLRIGDYVGWHNKETVENSDYIFTKKFGFIKWLVENDKIDIESYCRITSIERKGEKDVYRDEVDSLLMLLAIQDEPINFLLEILK